VTPENVSASESGEFFNRIDPKQASDRRDQKPRSGHWLASRRAEQLHSRHMNSVDDITGCVVPWRDGAL